MFSKFTEEAQKALVMAKKEMVDLKHPYVGSEHLLLAILKNKDSAVTKQLFSFQLNYQKFRDELVHVVGIGTAENHWFLYTPLLKRVIEDAMLSAKENNDGLVTIEHLFSAILEEGEGVAVRILLGLEVDLDQLYELFSTKFVNKKNQVKKKLMIDDYAVDFNKRAQQNEIDPVIGRDLELARVIEILSRRTKNNPLLIGEAGVGKTAIVEELARKITMGDVPSILKGKRVLSLSIAGLVAGTKYRGEFEERINKMLKEVEENDDIILFIDEMHTLVGAGGAEGAIDASNILKPVLARGKMRLIGATTTEEYKQFIERDKAFARRFQTVMVEEPDEERTLAILKKLKPLYEGYHRVVFADDLLPLLVDLSNRYIYDRKQPDKAIDLLDEVCAKVSLQEDGFEAKRMKLERSYRSILDEKNKAIMNQDFALASSLKEKEQRLEDRLNRLVMKSQKVTLKKVDRSTLIRIVEEKTKIPVYEIGKVSISQLQELEERLNSQVLGQEQVIHQLCNETKRLFFGMRDSSRPMSFLFLGKTGVGKTELVRAYAKEIVGLDHFIRLDMSEYKEAHTISRIVGSPPGYVGYQDQGNVLEQVRTNPYSVILLDEIEKAHPSIMQLFLQALDEGKMKSARGTEVRFDHVIFMMTSNIGCNTEHLGFKEGENPVVRQLKDFLSTEFINRIDHIFTFSPITKEVAERIVRLQLKEAQEVFQKKGISLSFEDSIIDEILQLCRYEEFGARRIRREMQEKIDLLVIDQLMMGKKRIRLKTLSSAS